MTVFLCVMCTYYDSMQVPVSNTKLVQRMGHVAAALAITPECIEVVLFGGRRDYFKSPIAETAVLRFGRFSIRV